MPGVERLKDNKISYQSICYFQSASLPQLANILHSISLLNTQESFRRSIKLRERKLQFVFCLLRVFCQYNANWVRNKQI